MVADVLPLVVPAFEMSIASQGMSKGTLQSEGPQFVPRAMVKVRRLQFGGQWRNVSTNSDGNQYGVDMLFSKIRNHFFRRWPF